MFWDWYEVRRYITGAGYTYTVTENPVNIRRY